jgi:hypothetical protein
MQGSRDHGGEMGLAAQSGGQLLFHLISRLYEWPNARVFG